MAKSDFRKSASRPLTPSEFARLSSSLQLALLAIRRAQLSSRLAVAVLSAAQKAQRSP